MLTQGAASALRAQKSAVAHEALSDKARSIALNSLVPGSNYLVRLHFAGVDTFMLSHPDFFKQVYRKT